ncbi:unnamed protein product [Calicophoron daubneyi]|uniref:SOCS box domain-containing protein n=1 Tax=Calicophoron daubneyi TaxID=300641 RepID=A0AAV2T1A2_CALDB
MRTATQTQPAVSFERTVREEIISYVENDRFDMIVGHLVDPTQQPEKNYSLGHWITELTSFSATGFENLLHISAKLHATKCISLLVSHPYCWNPDRPNGQGRSAVYYTASKSYLTPLYELALHSNTAPYIERWESKIVTLLIWPSLLWKADLRKCWKTLFHTQYFDVPDAYHWYGGTQKPKENPFPPALLFELIMATPFACNVNIWSSDRIQSTNASFWPITLRRLELPPEHEYMCDNYPHCLDGILEHHMRSHGYLRDPQVLWAALRNVWMHHSFSSPTRTKHSCLVCQRPPRLKAMCRAVIRRLLVQNYDKSKPQNAARSIPNYLRLVKTLTLPPQLHDYLNYRDLWPTKIHDPYSEHRKNSDKVVYFYGTG